MKGKKSSFAIIGIVFIYVSCGNIVDRNANMSPEEIRLYEIERNLRDMPEIVNPPEGEIKEVIPADDPRNQDIPGYDPSIPTVVIRHEDSIGFNQGVCLDPASDIIWLGSIIDGGTIRDGRYIPLSIKRGPTTLSTSNHTQGKSYVTIPEASLSHVRDAVKQILTSSTFVNCTSMPDFYKDEVYNQTQLAQLMGGTQNNKEIFSAFSDKIRSFYDFSSTSIKTRILVRFSQPFFPLDMDIPQEPSDFFDPSVTWEEISDACSTTTAPVYVSSMKYGRGGYFFITSELSISEVMKALAEVEKVSLGYSSAANTESINSSTDSILSQCQVLGYIYGGDPTLAASGVTGYKNFIKWIQTENYSPNFPVQPISYTLRYLKDNSVADVVLSSTYYVRHTEPESIPDPTPTPPNNYRLTISNISFEHRFHDYLNEYVSQHGPLYLGMNIKVIFPPNTKLAEATIMPERLFNIDVFEKSRTFYLNQSSTFLIPSSYPGGSSLYLYYSCETIPETQLDLQYIDTTSDWQLNRSITFPIGDLAATANYTIELL